MCKEEYNYEEDIIQCPLCSAPLIFRYKLENFRENFIGSDIKSIWRYNILPVDKNGCVSLGEGLTYLHLGRWLAEIFGFKGKIYLKDESTNPTGSFVDRGVSIAVSNALRKGYKVVSTVSPGNLGASLAAYASKAGLDTIIYTPSNIEAGKLYQILMYNGRVSIVQDMERGIEEAIKLFYEKTYPILPNNPYYFEGVKTVSYEICEDLGWDTPDIVIVPMGNGGLIYSIWKGFTELYELGFTDKVPKMVGVQFRGISPIIDRIAGPEERKLADSVPELSISKPLNINLAIAAIKDSGGYGVRVDHEEAIEALRLLAEKEGVFVELAAASTISAIKYVLEKNSPEKIVCILTGNGLKDPATIRELTRNIRRRLGFEAEDRRVIGKTKIEVLRAIRDGNDYGYAIWKHLSRRGLALKLPTVYQHLSELEKMRLIKIVSKRGLNRQMTVYTLTRKGRDALRYLG